MPSLDLLVPLLIAVVLLTVTPGPGMLYTAAQTISRGTKPGLYAAMGLHLGSYVHIAAAAFSLSFLLTAVPIVYTVVKFLGAAYLIWLGIRFVTTDLKAPPIHQEAVGLGHIKALRQSMTVEILNPKSALFFVAFLPQFSDPAASLPLWAQILALGVLVNVAFSLADIVYVLLAGKAAQLIRGSQHATRWLRRLGGTILAGLGVNLALSDLR